MFALGRAASPFPLPSPGPRGPRPQPLSERPFGETRKKCVCFISNGSRPVGRTRTEGREAVGSERDPPRRPAPCPPPCRWSDRPPSELILSVRSFVRSPAPRSLVRFGVSLQFRRRRGPIRQAAAEKQRFDRSDLKGERKRERKGRQRGGRDVGRGRWGKRARRGGEEEGG